MFRIRAGQIAYFEGKAIGKLLTDMGQHGGD